MFQVEPGRELLARWGRWRRLSDAEAQQAAVDWRVALGVRQSVRLERISRHQVVNERGRRGCSLVGVVYDEHTARIYHTRALTAEDLIHELLHVAYPSWGEEAVVLATTQLLGAARRPRSEPVPRRAASRAPARLHENPEPAPIL